MSPKLKLIGIAGVILTVTTLAVVFTSSKLSASTDVKIASKIFPGEFFTLSPGDANSADRLTQNNYPDNYTHGDLYKSADSLIYENDSTFTIETMKSELQNDGEWIKVTPAEVDPEGITDGSGGFDPDINTDYVWRPHGTPAGWSPYTNGYWRYSNCGWMWVSYYHWGWRPYHYGRWWWSPIYGWVWSPGYVFAPAWVVWMYNDDYCGWYPISPRVRCHAYEYHCYNMRYRVRHWNFCHKRDFYDPLTPPIVIVDPVGNNTIIKSSVFNGNVTATVKGVVNEGPSVTSIEKYTKTKIAVDDVSKYTTKIKNGDKNDKSNKDDRTNVRKTDDNSSINGNGNTRDKGGNNTTINNDRTTTKDNGTKDNGSRDNGSKDNNTNTKRDNGNKNDGGYKNDGGNKNNDTKKNNDGVKKNEEKRSDDKRSNEKPKDYTPPKKDNTPKKEYNQPKKKSSPPPEKKESPRKESPKKEYNEPKKEYNEPKRDNGNNNNGSSKKSNDSPPPVKQKESAPKDNGSKNDNSTKDNGKGNGKK